MERKLIWGIGMTSSRIGLGTWSIGGSMWGGSGEIRAIGVSNFSPTLSGRMRRDTRFLGDDLRQMDPKFQPRRYGQYLDAVAALDRLAHERYGRNVLALAVRFILDQGPTIALWGARRPEQLAPIHDVLGWRLDEETRVAIDRLLAEIVTDPVGPDFMARRAREAAPRGAIVSLPPGRRVCVVDDRHQIRTG